MSEAASRPRGHRHRAEAFRRAVCYYLLGTGLDVEQRDTTSPKSIREAVLEPQEQADIQGLTELAIITRAEYKQDWSGALDAAVSAARRDHKRWGAAIQWRRDRPASENFVVLQLGDFAEILRRLEGLPD